MAPHRYAPSLPLVESVERRLLFAAGIPRPDHVVIVVEENRWYHEIIGYRGAPYINELAQRGALMTNYYGVAYPSQPNYIALFSGSTHGVDDNDKPDPIDAPSLGGELIKAGFDFAGYAESLPSVGYNGTRYNDYRRHHAPWTNFADVPRSVQLPFSHFPDEDDYDELPDLSFVIPDMEHNMHPDAPREDGDDWLEDNLDPYIEWAEDNNSLFILTWDEDDREHDNHIVTLFVGPMVKPGRYDTRYDHYDLLRTLEDMFDLPHLGRSADRYGGTPIREVWRTPGVAGPRVVGRHLFYNNSAYDGFSRVADARDDRAIATDKAPLLPGQRATDDNVSSYTRGINGVMVDVANLPAGATVGGGDLVLRVGDGRGAWSAAPSPRLITTRRGAGADGSARITLTWPDRSVVNQWLQVTVRATPRTGLARDDVFYFGNLAGESAAGPSTSMLAVSAADLAATRGRLDDGDASVPAAGPADPLDHDRNGSIDLYDVLAVRGNFARALNLFTGASASAAALLASPAPRRED